MIKKISLFALIVMISIFYAAHVSGALVTIPDKSPSDSLTSAELNQILDAIKDGTKEINCAGLRVAGTSMITTLTEINRIHGANVSSADFIALGNMPDSGNIVSDKGADTLSNKTIDSDSNTVSLAVGVLKGVLADSSDMNYARDLHDTGVTNTEFAKLSGLGGNIVTDTMTAVLENKTMRGGANTFEDIPVSALGGVLADSSDMNYARDLHDTGVTPGEFDVLDGLTPSTSQLNILADDGAKGNALLGRNGSGEMGNIQEINGNANATSPVEFLNMPFWVTEEVNYDDSSPKNIFIVGSSYMVHEVIVEVIDAWDDGSKAFEVGYPDDPNGFVEDLGAGLENAKYYGYTNSTLGSRLYDTTDKYRKPYIFSQVDTIKATFVGSGDGGSQGKCQVFVMISRLVK